MCSATVRSVTHVGSLTVFSRTHAPGEKSQIIGVREQRITSFFVHILIGSAIALAPLLREVPLAVLFGVFLYMGIVSLNGIQMVDRLILMLMPVKHHPDVSYTRKVRTKCPNQSVVQRNIEYVKTEFQPRCTSLES